MSGLIDEARYLLREAHRQGEPGPLRWEISTEALLELMRDRQFTDYGTKHPQELMGLPFTINRSMIGQSVVLLRL